MPVVKTPTSSLTGALTPHLSSSFWLSHCADSTLAPELLFNKLWYRTSAKIKQLFYGSTREPSIAYSSPITKLPQDVVEVIISYLIYNMPSLLACSLTCFSWYIAAVPHLHHALTTDRDHIHHVGPGTKRKWPGPLKRSYELGLLPLVKQFRIRLEREGHTIFTPAWLDRRTLRYFSALTNLQELGIDYLDVSSFMPTIQQCFGHLSPTLRLLALKDPRGSCQQVLYLIGLFPNLQDLKLRGLYYRHEEEEEDMADAMLVPPSVPPLRGSLTLIYFGRKKLMKGMITLFGGLRFRHLDLFEVGYVQLLLDACTETLETLRLYPTDGYCEGFLRGGMEQVQLRNS